MKSTLSFLFSLFLCNASISSDVQAQWELLHDFGDAPAIVRDLEFHHDFGLPHKGFIVRSESCKINPVVQSTDGGLSWYPTPVDNKANMFGNNFAFLDANVGFLAMSGNSAGKAAIERTTDGGTTWHALTKFGSSQWVSVNRWKQHVFLSMYASDGRPFLLRSLDKGMTWNQINVSTWSEITFTNANDGFAVDSQRYAYTRDGGATWSYRSFPFISQMFGIPNSTTWFAITKDYPGVGREILHQSTDAGSTWTQSLLPESFKSYFDYYGIGSYFTWSGSKIFAQGAQGVQHSSDFGQTWSHLCGTHYNRYVYAYNDSVWASDFESRLWVNRILKSGKTLPNRAGWGGFNSSSNCTPGANLVCATRAHLVIFNRNACDPTIIKRIEMSGAPYFYELKVPTLPFRIDSLYFLEFEFEGITSEVRTGKFRITYEVQGHEFDTVVTYYAKSLNPISIKLNSDSIGVRFKNTCDTLRTSVQLEMKLPCDSLILIRSWLEDSSIFRITHSDFPNTRYSSSGTEYATVGLIASAAKGGVYTTKLHLQFKYRKITFDTIVDLKLTVPQTTRPEITTYLLDDERQCRILDSLLELTNTACDTLTIDAASLIAKSIFELGGLQLPMKVAPGQTIRIPFSHTLDTIGGFEARLRLEMRLGVDQLDTVVFLRANIAPSPILTVKDLYAFNDICDLRDTSLLIVNNRCVPVQLKAVVVLSGPATVLGALPVTIPAVSQARVGVRFSSTTQGVDFVRLRLTYEINGFTTDTLVLIRVSIQAPSSISVTYPPKHDFGSVSTCTSVIASITVTNDGCESVQLTAIALSNSGDYTIVQAPGLPEDLPAGNSLILQIHFAPTQLGVRSSDLRLSLSNSRVIKDISIPLTGRGESAGPGVIRLQPDAVDFGVSGACDQDSTLVEIVNTGCDDVLLENGSLTGDQTFTLIDADFKTRLAPAEKTAVWVRLDPNALGTRSATLRFRSRSESNSTWIESSLVVSADVVLQPDPVAFISPAFNEISECMIDSSSLRLTNNGCTPQEVSVTVGGPFRLGSASIVLQPAETRDVRVYFDPLSDGLASEQLLLTARDLKYNVVSQTSQLNVTASAIAGEKLLSLSEHAIDFGETNICDVLDTAITLTNEGCDTIFVTEANIDRNFSIDADWPIAILPGESMRLGITSIVDTAGKPQSLNGRLDLITTADNALHSVAFTRKLIYPTKLRLEAVDEASGKAGDLVKFRIILEGDVPSTMTALHFDFLHNNDLLSFEDLSSQDLRITSTQGNDQQVQRFTLSPVREAGVLGELTFKAYLAEAEQTTLSFDNITFEAEGVSFAPECIAVISDSGSRFDFVYTCGDGLLRSTLRGQTLIKSLTPNPARDEVRLELADGIEAAEVTIMDLLGAGVLQARTTDRIDVRDLVSGTYYIRVFTNDMVQTRRIVISR